MEYNTICTFFCYDTNEQSVIERFVDLTKYQEKDIISIEVQNNGSFRWNQKRSKENIYSDTINAGNRIRT